MNTNTYTAFDGQKMFTQGSLEEVVLKIKRKLKPTEDNTSVLIFSDSTGKTMDFNFQGTEKDVLKRLEVFSSDGDIKASAGPGRPKLGVTAREISLLPRHWEWLANQPQGSSATLRLLVETAMKKSEGASEVKKAQERTYKFMNVMAGDSAHYEEALRALYKKDKKSFQQIIANWPSDVCEHAWALAAPVFE